ncbi:MAG: hypothetical protein ABF633_01835 [Clostridium sp.]|uniref:hypothetical protein n=1 Tax=Clostridium sp. TaxID=1506 RepID=UPI0039EB5109
MKVYKLSSEQLNKSISRIFLRTISLCILALVIGLYISLRNGTVSILTFAMVIILIAIVLTISIQKGLKKQKESLLSYELIILDNSIVKKQLKFPTIEIEYNSILRVEEIPNKGLIIKAKDENKTIGIPYYLTDYDEVKNVLSKYADIDIKKSTNTSLIKVLQYALPISVVLAVIIVITSNNKYLIMLLGTAYILFFLWFIIEIQRNKQINLKLKRRYLFLLFPLLSVILKMIVVFFYY